MLNTLEPFLEIVSVYGEKHTLRFKIIQNDHLTAIDIKRNTTFNSGCITLIEKVCSCMRHSLLLRFRYMVELIYRLNKI